MKVKANRSEIIIFGCFKENMAMELCHIETM